MSGPRLGRRGAPATGASVWFQYTDTTGSGLLATMEGSSYTGGLLITEGDPLLGNFLTCGPTTAGVNTVPGTTCFISAFSDTPGVNRGGKAASVSFAFACGVLECSVGYSEQTVQLSGGRKR